MSDDTVIDLAATTLIATPWDESRPCLVCGGHPGIVRAEQHCTGGLRADAQVAYCTVREAAGKFLAHKLGGGCGCGVFHPRLPGGNGQSPEELNGYHHGPDGLPAFTDTRNAQRLVDRFTDIRKDFTRGKKRSLAGWYIWSQVRWALDETERMVTRAKEVVEHLPEEIPLDTGLHAKTIKALRDDCLACESTGRLSSMISNAGSLVPATHETWDRDPYLLNCRNGTLDLRTGNLLPHDPERYQSKLVPFDFDPDCPTPVWDAFLERVFGGDQDLIDFVQRAVGLSLVGAVMEHVLFVMYGTGANGKSTFLNVWLELLGDYSRAASMDLLVEQKNPQHPTSIAELVGVRFVSTSEVDGRFSERMVKMLTGGDVRNARFLFEDAFVYVPTDTFWLSTNHKPVITGNSEGIWRRIRLIPFEAEIPLEEQDLDLPAKLRAEYPGILAWAVAGCSSWREHGLGRSRAVDAATAVYRGEMDTLATFLGDRCVVEPEASVAAAELHKAYEAWCEETGERPAGQRWFGIRLGERGFTRQKRGRERRWHWIGLRIRGDDDLPFDDDSPPTVPEEPPQASMFDAEQGNRIERPVEKNPSDSQSEFKQTLEPVIPVKAHADAGLTPHEDFTTARTRARGINGISGFTGSTELDPAGHGSVKAITSDTARAPNGSSECTLPARDGPPGGPDACPDCGAAMYHRQHLGHWDHECQRCTLRFQTP